MVEVLTMKVDIPKRITEAGYGRARLDPEAYTKLGLSIGNIIEITGKTLGIIGMGTIGQKVASVASAFGMRVIYFSTSGTGHCKDYPCVDLDTLLAESDVVSIHAPLNARTQGLLKMAELRKMKP